MNGNANFKLLFHWYSQTQWSFLKILRIKYIWIMNFLSIWSIFFNFELWKRKIIHKSFPRSRIQVMKKLYISIISYIRIKYFVSTTKLLWVWQCFAFAPYNILYYSLYTQSPLLLFAQWNSSEQVSEVDCYSIICREMIAERTERC